MENDGASCARCKPACGKTLGEIILSGDARDCAENDKFQVITEHAPGGLDLAEGYLGNRYSKDVILIQMTISFGALNRHSTSAVV